MIGQSITIKDKKDSMIRIGKGSKLINEYYRLNQQQQLLIITIRQNHSILVEKNHSISMRGKILNELMYMTDKTFINGRSTQ